MKGFKLGVIIQNNKSIIIDNNKLIINGEEIKLPNNIKNKSKSIINGKVFIGGYEYFPKNKKFKRTFRALWELIF